MSSFTYKSLPDGGNFTRMVQLLPNVNSDAPVECHLLDYDLGSTEYQPHVYEALSYCWGSQNKPESAILNGLTLPITTNLKAALQHLRDSQLPRTVWIDAICINQDDNKEKGKQIPLMRRIYAQASQVIVWLGDCTDAGDKALEELRDPAMIWTGYSEITSKLLQRDWFQRIWVLQEVGVARSISIMCGTTQISGHAFCEGLNRKNSSDDIMKQVGPIAYLMKSAPFRSRNKINPHGDMSLSTLVGMYPNHHATQPHDKVYALLGLANEEDAKNLWPDYDIEWHEVLIRLAQLTFPQSSVQAWSGNEFVVIKCKGNVLGYVCNATPSNGQQKITILYNSQAEKWGYRWKWESVWTVEEMAVSIQDGDMICMIQERSEPSVIRLCGDHFALIIPVARPVLSRTLEMDTYSEDEIYEVDDGTTAVYQGPSNDICLKWRVMGDEQISETSSETRLTELAPGYRQSKSESEAQLDHIARIMEGIFGIPEKEHLNNKAMENIIFQCDKNIPLTRIAWVTAANEGYIGPDIMEALFKHWGQDLPVDESVVIAAAENIGEAGFAILETFFRHRGQNVPVSPSVVQSAIWNKSKARLRIFEVLFKYLGRNVPITEDHVKILVKREYSNEVPMLKVLSRQYGRNLPVTEEVVQAAAQNKGEHGTEIMEILAEHQPGGQFWNPVK